MNDSDGDCPYYCSSEEEEGGVEPAEIDIGPLDDDLIPEASQGPNLDGDDDYTIANQSIPVVTNQRDDPRDEEAVDDVKQDVESRPQRKEKRRRLAKEPRNAAILSPQIGNKVSMLVDEMRTMDVESRNGLMRRDNATQTQKALDLEYKMLVQRTKNNQFELELENRRRKLLDERARMYDDAARRLQQERDVQFPSLIYAQSPSFDYHPYNSGNRRAPSPTAFFYKEERPDPIAYVSDQYRKHEKGRATTNRQKESSRSEEAGSGGGGGGKKRGVADAFGEYYQSQPLQDDDLRIKLQPKADVYLPSEPVVSFRGLRDPPAPSGGGKGADRRIVQQSGRHK